MRKIQLPLSAETIRSLHAGDEVRLSGTVYTARDAAHKKLDDLVNEGKPLPIDLKGAVIYYVGPTPPPPDSAPGSGCPSPRPPATGSSLKNL